MQGFCTINMDNLPDLGPTIPETSFKKNIPPRWTPTNHHDPMILASEKHTKKITPRSISSPGFLGGVSMSKTAMMLLVIR